MFNYQDQKVIVKPSPNKGNGLFAAIDIKKGELILLAKVTMMSKKDWQIIKDTMPVKLYGFRWDTEYGIPLGKWKFKFNNIKDRLLWKQTDFYKKYCPDGLKLSGFLFVNDIDVNTTANVQEFINVSKNIVGIKAIKNINAGEELIKEYNYDWHEEFQSWRKGILEGLNLAKKYVSPSERAAEPWFTNLFNKMKQTPDIDFPEDINFKIDGQIYMYYERNGDKLWINYYKIYFDLPSKFILNTQQIKDLITRVVERNTNLWGFTTHIQG